MADTEVPVPEIHTDSDTVTVNDPLLGSPQVTVPSQSGTGDRASRRFSMLLGFIHSRRGAEALRIVFHLNVAEEMENWREEWGNSLPVVVLDTLWNLAFAAVSFGAFMWIEPEEVETCERELVLERQLRVWMFVYSVLCVIYVMILWTEYITRGRGVSTAPIETPILPRRNSDDEGPPGSCALFHTAIYYIWWTVGFLAMGSYYIEHGSSRLFWLTVVVLATDVFFLALALLFLGLLVAGFFLCFPCIRSVMYCITNKEERASEAEINNLPKYIFKVTNGDVEQPDVRACKMTPMETNGPNFSTERVLLTEEADCCICRGHYEDGEELRSLRCSHHFHSKCITKWLRVKGTCPLCKSLIV